MLKPSLTILRVFIALEWLLALAFFYFSFALKADLPELLQPYLENLSVEGNGPSGLALAIGFALVFANLTALIGLWFEATGARALYFFTTPAILFICLFLGPKVDHAVAYTLDVLSVFFMGLIVCHLLYAKPQST